MQETYLNVIAGRPGAGKTIYVRNEIEDLLRDKERIVILIDCKYPEYLADTNYGNFLFFDFAHAGTGIGKAMDIANYGLPVYLFYDQNRYEMKPYIRDSLVLASKSGVNVNVTVQRFRQVDGGDKQWLRKNCYTYIISKRRAPRTALENEINETYA